jgi:hypothetical protein
MAVQHGEGNAAGGQEPRLRIGTVYLSAGAFDAIAEIQRQYRRNQRKALPLWKVLEEAVSVYAKQQGISINR